MPQNADKVIDHECFPRAGVQEMFANKKSDFEFNHADEQDRRDP
jgi:hypothetical protein